MPVKLDVKFIGPDLDFLLEKVTQQLEPDKWIKKKNSIINKGLKASAELVMPHVKSGMNKRTGVSAAETYIARVRGGGWRISPPTRKVLADQYPKALKAKGYYPAAQEYGWKDKDGGSHSGTSAMSSAMEENRNAALLEAEAEMRIGLDRLMKRHIRRKVRLHKKRTRAIKKVTKPIKKYTKAKKKKVKKFMKTKTRAIKKSYKAKKRVVQKKVKAFRKKFKG